MADQMDLFTQPDTLRYAHDRPTRPGHYWIRQGPYENVVQVTFDSKGVGWITWGGGGTTYLESADASTLWAGPLEAPLEPAKEEGT